MAGFGQMTRIRSIGCDEGVRVSEAFSESPGKEVAIREEPGTDRHF
jgi:hypothetical protein